MTPDELDELSRKADLQEGKWQKGVAGNSNLVAYNGEDVVGVGAIFSEARLEFIAALVNYWRSGGAELVRDGKMLRDLWEAEYFCEDASVFWKRRNDIEARKYEYCKATHDAARKDMSAELKGEGG